MDAVTENDMKSSLLLLAPLALLSISARADDAPHVPQSACFQAEGFASEAAWSAQLRDWKNEAPPFPGPLNAWRGYETAKREQDFARNHFRNDKQQHCYVGCRITQDVNFDTSQYAGWEKERRDLTDCNSGTRFEIADYSATVAGAHF